MIDIEIDEQYIKETFYKELEKRLEALEAQAVFWDMKDLRENTRMSVNTIKDTFFYDERFPKFKVGQKWYFPAKETEDFLLKWLKEQRRR